MDCDIFQVIVKWIGICYHGRATTLYVYSIYYLTPLVLVNLKFCQPGRFCNVYISCFFYFHVVIQLWLPRQLTIKPIINDNKLCASSTQSYRKYCKFIPQFRIKSISQPNYLFTCLLLVLYPEQGIHYTYRGCSESDIQDVLSRTYRVS